MWALIISISCSVAVSVLLKIARQKNLHIPQVIAFNYVMAIALSVFWFNPQPLAFFNQSSINSYAIVVALGVLLPTVFLIMAKAVQQAGIVLSDAAQRLSLVIPLLAAATLFGEHIAGNKLLGILLGLSALLCLSVGAKRFQQHPNSRSSIWLIGVWLGYGVIDVLFKQLAKSGASFSSYLLITFSLAALLLFGWLLLQRTVWHRRSLYTGLFLGLLNFSNIYFYIRAHQLFPANPTLVFTTMNIGVITLGTLVGALFFKEKLSAFSVGGIVLAVGAVLLLMP